jgi:hypothetical protein
MIVLRLCKLVPGWVESYVGRSELVDLVDAEEEPSIGELVESVEQLAETVRLEEPEPDRRRWLLAQLRAISTALLWLGGERLSYAALFERCHGGSVELVPNLQFEQAHALLDRALPHQGDVAARYRAWRQTQLVSQDRLQASLHLLAEEMRSRCREIFGLPDGELVTWKLVSGEPWAGNADYLGQRETLIRINMDLPISSARLLELVCHEAYPGHHTEGVCKDASLIQAAGREELSVYVYPTPQALISEGLASYALEALLGDDAEQIAADCLKPAGIPYDHETASVVREAETLLLPVRSNIALMLDDGTTSLQAHEYARAWLLDDVKQIDEAIEHLEGRSWRPYESCYPVGLALCRRYVGADPRRFHELLHRQLTPADLTGQTAAALDAAQSTSHIGQPPDA